MANNNKHTGPNVPALRFPEFSGEWESRTIGDDCKILMCKRIFANQTTSEGEVPFYKIGTIGDKADAYISKKLFEEYKQRYNYPKCGEVMITCAGTVGKTILYNGQDAYYQDSNIVWISNPRKIYSNEFLNYLLNRVDWSKLNSTTITRIYNDNLRELHITFPSREEQDKIVSLLTRIDDRIDTQSKIIEELTTLRSALLEKVFQVSNPTLEVGAISHQTSERNKLCRYSNVLSVSNRFGFINQSEQFEDRNVASDDVRNYKVVHRGDFAYNPARINVGSIAMLKSFESGIVSPMYICFQVDDTIVDPSFFELFLETKAFKDEMEIRLEGSVRRCLSFEALCEIHLPLPALLVQRSISNKIGNISAKIKLEDRILRTYIRQKEWLLKQMFI